jgi:spermidine synthase
MVKKAPEGFLFLRNNGKTDASTDQDLDDLHLIGILPMLLHKDPQDVLVIGMGSGITAGSVISYPVKQLDIVDIEPAVFAAAGYFGDYNNQVLKDPRVKTIATDARGYLMHQRQLYDVITSQPSNLWVKGNASLFSQEFYHIAKQKLKPDGLMLQWVPFYGFTETEFKTVVKTFMSVFPHTTMWTPVVSHDVLLVGSAEPQQYDGEKISERLELPAIAKDLKETAITTTQILAAHYLGDEEQLRSLIESQTIPINTDNRPRLEYSNPFNMFKSTEKENLIQILSLKGDYQQHIELTEADKSIVAEAKEAVILTLDAKRKSAEDDLEGAAADFETALGILPKLGTKKELARLYFELARRSYSEKDPQKTVAFFEKSIQAYPNSQVYLNLSILYLSQGRYAKAKEALQQAKILEPANPRIGEVEKSLIQQSK